MKRNNVSLTKEFKNQVYKSIFSIILFVISYLIIIVFAISLAILCVVGAGSLIIINPKLITILLGLGLGSLGFFILLFLFQFLFRSKEENDFGGLEISKNDQPELFKMIDELVNEIGTSFPKKVYLTSDVNASVYYDSSFWSMFLPVKKNLRIGLGLINTTTQDELRAILAHEFGHFSQSSMKLGSYVYNLNYTVYNLLFDSTEYNNAAKKWAAYSNYFSIFVKIADVLNSSISFVLKYLFSVLNKSYYALSREMEFHADEISAVSIGSEQLKTSLLRLNFSEYAYNEVINFYKFNNENNLIPKNLYDNQLEILSEFANRNKFILKGNLPYLSLEDHKRFDKSKLIIKDQWASHPTIEGRIKRLNSIKSISTNLNSSPAILLLKEFTKLNQFFIEKLFPNSDLNNARLIDSKEFVSRYNIELEKNSLPSFFNGYYNDKSPIYFEGLEKNKDIMADHKFNDFFNISWVNKVNELTALNNDIHLIKSIANDFIEASTFDYDGKRYSKKDAKNLYLELEKVQNELNHQIIENDKNIFRFLFAIKDNELENDLDKVFQEYNNFEGLFNDKVNLYDKCLQMLSFTGTDLEFEDIILNFKRFKPIEEQLKDELTELLSNSLLINELNADLKQKLNEFLEQELVYFRNNKYLNDNLEILYTSINSYFYLLNKKYFLLKKNLLQKFEELNRSI